MAVQWWSLTGPGLVSEALAGEIEHKEGEIQENSIDPRRCRADPRRKGAWCKTGFAGNWIHGNGGLVMLHVVREDWMQHGPSWHDWENMP